MRSDIVIAALEVAVEFNVFRAEYVENIVMQKQRENGLPAGRLHVPKAGDLLDLKITQPNLQNYKINY